MHCVSANTCKEVNIDLKIRKKYLHYIVCPLEGADRFVFQLLVIDLKDLMILNNCSTNCNTVKLMDFSFKCMLKSEVIISKREANIFISYLIFINFSSIFTLTLSEIFFAIRSFIHSFIHSCIKFFSRISCRLSQ